MKITTAAICCALSGEPTVGSRVCKTDAFIAVLETAVNGHKTARDDVPGQHFVRLPVEANELVSAGVGRRTANPDDYVIRVNRGYVSAYLRRELALPTESVAAVVYTTAAYAADPQVTPAEADRVRGLGASHVLVAVLASAGPKAPLTPHRLVANLAGGNKATLAWDADKIRAVASEVVAYDAEFCVVAD